MRKVKQYKYMILLVLITLGGVFYYLNFINEDGIIAETIGESAMEEENVEEPITEEGCSFTSNVGWTECMFVLLDKKAAEREWKMLKLESLTRDDVNNNEMLGNIEDHVKVIKKWREGFEEYRDNWCETEKIYYAGSGTSGQITGCRLYFEKLAIEQLDYLHDKLVESAYSKPIENFEPTKEQLVEIMNSNKTFRGCVWAGEDNFDEENKCEDREYKVSDFDILE